MQNVFEVEYLFQRLIRRLRAKLNKLQLRQPLTAPLALRYLSVLVISYNIFFTPIVIHSGSSGDSPRGPEGLVLSQTAPAPAGLLRPVKQKEAPIEAKFLGKAALIIDATSSAVLFEKNSQQRVPVGSLTKMMTALLVLEQRSLADELTVSEACTRVEGVNVGFKAGQKISVETALYSLLLPSASDAACVLSESLGGEATGSADFVRKMNQKALSLGMVNTNFTNAIGLDGPNGDHFSTAVDMVRLTQEFLRNEDLAKIVATPQKVVNIFDGRQKLILKTTNELLNPNGGFLGVKTGLTPKALGCFSFLFEQDGKKILGVILGSPDRFADAKVLVAWVFENYRWQ